MGEHLPCTQGVKGSNPFVSTYPRRIMIGPVVQLVSTPPCHGGGRGFESLLGRFGRLAQLGEHLPYKQGVIGSSPIATIFNLKKHRILRCFFILLRGVEGIDF